MFALPFLAALLLAGPTSFSGTYRVPAAARPAAISVALANGTATVELAPGHAAHQVVPARLQDTAVRFTLPGRPAPLVFAGRIHGKRLTGTVAQGAARGSFVLTRTRRFEPTPVGLFDLGGGEILAGTVFGDGLPRAAFLDAGEIGILTRREPRVYSVGAGVSVRQPERGLLTVGAGATRVTWSGRVAPRIPLRQLEVRFPSRGIVLAGTLTIPAGPGPFPAVALVHGSGEWTRVESLTTASFLAAHGFVTLTYDKRGVGQSGGVYPGERANESTIDVLAHDAAAAVRFLAAQPEVDRTRVGLEGDSQAGWIIPLAAAREPAVRFAVALVGPTVTVGEQEQYALLSSVGDESREELDADLDRVGPSGFDPAPSLRKLGIPMLWVLGELDRTVPTWRCVRVINRFVAEGSHDFTAVVLPRAGHALVETAHGRNEEVAASPRFAPGLFTSQLDWFRARGILR